ncbi:glutamate--tRNA ligase [Candidatus Collierbacteria bacterium RIFOXYB2_FULL_46_14]|uniref:Glutamate--tRNA ligase n=1 Tax=Candidatus Collierbacteria bacterium GW2011_GWA2_46_26 TaxID=1618381 RepID=A0A0G1PJK2_9BACT|nr:MAG: Glutamate-tRNA ligase [Candidatus Collierbacteria bacterium GW2011_GWC2_44_13]KKU32926.1 MAG: Glutamate-tRNA ligase [Candidatus Collierbacteria bacterium GW2011_GWA2_46_26]OGD72903.1 MAG: glutamate--tRNA ligase [Candidatus Collierbacteria bacterium RIFOXYB2_FULL_46_14]OGD75945.1 MAG: glutamate--tRNA ligase [Candidatus Collierbacteria bacterium RIFOXYA2_FULL_46_20]OGD77281.1 MAG: glutamate--tRNA ligase [Candidatus Collierbacteria bacterium RIFOXYC2_FULL_43_15]OGD80571.1 MAG: glutamate--
MADTHVRTRNAPSPTGVPHVGNTRTALFDYLLAKKYGGEFILRIEDTDQDRFVPGSIEKIYQIHDLLGLVRDEDPVVGGPFGPYIQSQRLEIYQKYASLLVGIDAAYPCFCSEERLKSLHEKDQFAKYDRFCRKLTSEEAQRKIAAGEPYVLRVKLPETGFTIWHDLVQGKLSLPNNECDDKVIMKTIGIPTYHLAVVIDDHLMKISHVLRGVEWMASTPVHLFLYEALGWQPPTFAHVPLLLGPDKSKLSKRHGAKSVLEYAEDGYLPEAINNFLFYLGFSYKDNSEMLTLDKMVEIFDEKKIQRQNAIFDIQRLNYLNSQWIKKMPIEDLFLRLNTYIPADWNDEKVKQILALVKERMFTLRDFAPAAEYFFTAPVVSVQSVLDQSGHSEKETVSWFETVKSVIKDISDFNSTVLHDELAKAQAISGFSPKEAFMSLRVAISGRSVTPPLFDCMVILGKDETLKRLSAIIS